MSDEEEEEEEEYHSTILGDGLYRTYFQKNERCFNVHRDGSGLHLATRRMLAGANGNDDLYVGSRVCDGKGLLLGSLSPF